MVKSDRRYERFVLWKQQNIAKKLESTQINEDMYFVHRSEDIKNLPRDLIQSPPKFQLEFVEIHKFLLQDTVVKMKTKSKPVEKFCRPHIWKVTYQEFWENSQNPTTRN